MGQQRTLRQHNRTQVLRALRDHGAFTRPQLADHVGISKVTVADIVNELTDEGIVTVREHSAATIGRPASRVHLAPQLGTVLGLDAQPHAVQILDGGLATRSLTSTPPRQQPTGQQGPTKTVVAAIRSAAKMASHGPLRAVCLSVPAPVDASQQPGEPNALRALDHHQVRRVCEELRVKLLLENDANLYAVAEHYDGAARPASAFAALLERDTGVGLGLFLEGRLYRGPHGRAGEFGVAPWRDPRAGHAAIEALPPQERYTALTYLLAGLASALDLSLIVTCTRQNGELQRKLRDLLPGSIALDFARHGERGPVRGAWLTAHDQAWRTLLGTSLLPERNPDVA